MVLPVNKAPEGSHNWYLPPFLRWLPTLQIELPDEFESDSSLKLVVTG